MRNSCVVNLEMSRIWVSKGDTQNLDLKNDDLGHWGVSQLLR